jgi:hypothetical protein
VEEWKGEIVGGGGGGGVVGKPKCGFAGSGEAAEYRHRVGLEYWALGRDCQIEAQRHAWLCMMEEDRGLLTSRVVRKRRISCTAKMAIGVYEILWFLGCKH